MVGPQQAAPTLGQDAVAEDPVAYVLVVLGRHAGAAGFELRQDVRPVRDHPGKTLGGGQIGGDDEAQRPGNTVQILTFEAGEYGSMGSAFSVLAFPEPADPGVVYIETRAGSLYLEGQQVREYSRIFDHLVATAASARESRDLIQGAIDER